MAYIPAKCTQLAWLWHNKSIYGQGDVVREYEEKNEVLNELISKYGLTKNRLKNEDGLLRTVVKEMQSRCKISLREIAGLLEIGRETLRIRLSTPPSP